MVRSRALPRGGASHAPGLEPALSYRRFILPMLATAGLLLVVTAVWCLRIVNEATSVEVLSNGDLYTYFYPMLEVAFSELRAGRLFLWNPYQLIGIPGLATLQIGLLYPPHLVYLALPTATGLAVMTLSHLMALALFTVLAGRALRFSWPAAVLAGCSFSVSASVLFFIFWPSSLEPFAWLPLGIAAVERVIRDNNRRWLPLLSIAVAMPLLSGGSQGAVYIFYAYLIYSVIAGSSVAWSQRSLHRAVVRELWLGIAVLAGLALAAPQLLPTLELAQQGARAGGLQLNQVLPYGPVATPSSLLHTALVPPIQFVPGYVGAVPLALACVAFCGRRRTIAAFSVVLLAWGVLGMLTPLWFLRARALLPALGYFRDPSRVFVLTNFGVALLAGAGLDALRQRENAAWARYLPAILLASSSALGAAVRYPHPSWVLAALVVPVGIAAVGRGAGFRLFLAPVIAALLLFDLVGFSRNRLFLPYVNDSWRQIGVHSRVLRDVAGLAERYRVLPMLGNPQVAPFDRICKAAMLEGFYSPLDYEILTIKRYADFLEYAIAGRTWPSDRSLPFMGGGVAEDGLMSSALRGRRFLNLVSVRFLIIPSGRALTDPALRRFVAGMRPVRIRGPNPDARNFIVLEDPEALPRAYGVYRAECPASFDEQLARLAAPDFDPTQVVILDGDCRSEDSAQGISPAVSIESYDATRVRLTADMQAPGFIVLTDSYYPGWKAFVNGKHVPIIRANTVVRAVRVPAGRSQIEFRYAPWSFYLGVGAATAAIAIGLLALIRQHAHHEHREPPGL